MKEIATGIQHIGIPTDNFEITKKFYHQLGFETAYETVNEENNGKVAFLKLHNLVIETYESDDVKMRYGAVDHIAIDVTDVEKAYEAICEKELNTLGDEIHFLPFWENGVRFFTIEGPNKERIEFSQFL